MNIISIDGFFKEMTAVVHEFIDHPSYVSYYLGSKQQRLICIFVVSIWHKKRFSHDEAQLLVHVAAKI